ncbi:MAG: glutamate 5-kinase [Chloroflexi bacterium]|nr:glutamate 5-kinase [Chloroflexota bacterium]
MRHRRLVVKLGTNVLTAGTDHLDLGVMASLVSQVAHLHKKEGAETIVVSSGAIAAGKQHLGPTKERKDIPFRQVMASVGQSRLMQAYDQLFGWHGITVAQTLLTKADLADRGGYLNARNTLLALLELGVVPIVNENDVVAIDEIREAKFGDNDNLSAMVANLVDADLLVLLTDTPGLHTTDPHLHPEAQLIPYVEKIDGDIEGLAGASDNQRGIGGMVTKLEAAKLATASGVAVVIASGQEPDVLPRLAQGEAVGTYFAPTTTKLESRKRWMLSGISVKGRLIVDDGAASAIKKQHKSLLPAGVSEVEGEFQRGDIVHICNVEENCLACGITNYSSKDVETIKGARSQRILDLLGYQYGDAVVHKNNLVVL